MEIFSETALAGEVWLVTVLGKGKQPAGKISGTGGLSGVKVYVSA